MDKLPKVLLDNLVSSYSIIDFKENESHLTSFLTDSCRSLLENDNIFGKNLANSQESQFSNCLLCVFVESAKLNLDVSYLSSQFDTEKCPPILTKIFCSVYESNKIALRSKLGQVEWRFPRIVDCDWKLDYQIKASDRDEINKPNFKLSFLTAEFDGEDLSKFSFDCSAEQLQELVWKLKEASKFVEKLAHGK